MAKPASLSNKTSKAGFFKQKKTKATKKTKSLRQVKAKTNLLTKLGIMNMTENNYISSPVDKPNLFSVRPVHLLSRHDGYGVFAEKEISAGTWVGEYTGQEFSHQEFDHYLETTPGTDNSYAMRIGDKVVDASSKGNYTRYINFSDNHANVEFVSTQLDDEESVVLIATRDITPGEQLLVDYNTYDERASKYFYFLNSQDGWLSTSEFYKAHLEFYEQHTSHQTIEVIELSAGQSYYSTPIGMKVLCNESLTAISKCSPKEVNLPYIRLKDNVIIDALEADLFTPLMIACLLGQVENVNWLVSQGADVNQQQNHSGNCPLFFALEGYMRNPEQRKSYVDIITLLIANQVNITVHDRFDMTFIHRACSILTTDDFEKVIRVITQVLGASCKEPFTYLNEANEDILIHCLNLRDFSKASILLATYPDYFEENLYQGELQEFNKEIFRKTIDSYSEHEKHEVVTIITRNSSKITTEFFSEFNLTNLTSKSSPSMYTSL
ncbi:Dot/Icm T4SS effector AnkI/LegAS4 [Legionella yabuuchiae]|uniref:Dot/Icm T4SS effector AnkI/LegAS4 n=1 Tax=Legionella yabuuchiae TaxID=376727 RepID=UPI001055A659|nr:Dot/Icm T4SS effector AnkI/LegAS4 [Legionella yabuuchiae]